MNKIKKQVSLLNNVLIFPAQNFSYSGNLDEIAGVETWTKNLPSYARYLNGRAVLSPKQRKLYLKTHKAKYMKGRYLYIGIMFEHFGHFLCESISMMWACKFYKDEVDGFILIPAVDKQVNNDINKNLINSILDILEVSKKKLYFLEELVEVESLIIPEMGHPPGLTPKVWYLEELKKKILKQKLNSPKFPKKIVVKRSARYMSKTIGINYFASLFARNDFYILYPEKFDIRTQLGYILSAKVIIWEEGSACHLCDLLPFSKKTENFIIKRKLYPTLADNAVVSKFSKVNIYNKLCIQKNLLLKNRFIEVSRFKDPKDLFNTLRNCGYIEKGKFIYFNFKLFELGELLTLYKINLLLELKVFLVKKLKPRVHEGFWRFLKKYSF